VRGINDGYFLVLVSESIREVLELGNIREEEKMHFNHSIVHMHFLPCHTCIYTIFTSKIIISVSVKKSINLIKYNPIMKNCLFV